MNCCKRSMVFITLVELGPNGLIPEASTARGTLPKVGTNEDISVVTTHGDVGRGSVNTGNGVHIATPFEKLVVTGWCYHETDHRPSIICEGPLPGDDYGATGCAHDGQHVLDRRIYLKVSHYGIVPVHGDAGSSPVDIANGADIAGPVDKMIPGMWSRHQDGHCSFVICKIPCTGSGYITSSGTGDREDIGR